MIALNTVVCDEAPRILGLLDHAAGYCDELVVVVDDASSDATYDLARDFGATVIHVPHSPYCEPQRPLAAAITRASWILVLDADEILSPEGVDLVVNFDHVAYEAAKLPRVNLIDGVSTSSSLDAHIRFFKRGWVRYTMGPHSRILPIPEARVFAPQSPEWIIHSKSSAERDWDHERSLTHR